MTLHSLSFSRASTAQELTGAGLTFASRPDGKDRVRGVHLWSSDARDEERTFPFLWLNSIPPVQDAISAFRLAGIMFSSENGNDSLLKVQEEIMNAELPMIGRIGFWIGKLNIVSFRFKDDTSALWGSAIGLDDHEFRSVRSGIKKLNRLPGMIDQYAKELELAAPPDLTIPEFERWR